MSKDRGNPKKKRFRHFKEYVTILLTTAATFVLLPCWVPCSSLVYLHDYECAVHFRLGRSTTNRAKGPGFVFLLPFTDKMVRVDLRTVSLRVPPQKILTKDSVTVTVAAAVFYRVTDPYTSVTRLADAHSFIQLLAETALRKDVRAKNMSELLDREIIAHGVQATVDKATDCLGIKVECVEITDVKLPLQLQQAIERKALDSMAKLD